jgi:hypothetical protein
MYTPMTGASFFNVSLLAEDDLNWIVSKGRLITAVNVRGSTMKQYIDESAVKPTPLQVDSTGIAQSPTGGTATLIKIKENLKEIQEYNYRNSLVKQQIFCTLTDKMYLRVQEFDSASAIWAELCAIHQDKTKLTQMDLRCHMHETQCQEGSDVKEHFGALRRLKQSLTGAGEIIETRYGDSMSILVGANLVVNPKG